MSIASRRTHERTVVSLWGLQPVEFVDTRRFERQTTLSIRLSTVSSSMSVPFCCASGGPITGSIPDAYGWVIMTDPGGVPSVLTTRTAKCSTCAYHCVAVELSDCAGTSEKYDGFGPNAAVSTVFAPATSCESGASGVDADSITGMCTSPAS